MNDDASTTATPAPSPTDASRAAFAPQRKRWDGSFWRLGLMVTLLIAVGVGLWYSSVYRRRAALLEAQQACLRYVRPPEEIVYEEDPGRAATLLQRNDGFVAVPLDDAGQPPAAGRTSATWAKVLRWAMPSVPPDKPADPLLFLHERRAADGDRGLVCVEADRAGRRLRITFVHLGGVSINPHAVTDLHLAPLPKEGLVILSPGRDPLATKLPAEPGARADLRFYAGRPDPADATHLVLPYEWDGRRGELELWVQSDQLVYYVDRLFAK